ncbi:hypothetical protein I4U23_011570 [Adineta vaga]|nr:hypothetical protein I4U23_011570 [Adineta vaga]
MLENENKIIGLILTSFNFGFTTFGTIISSIVLLILIYHLYYNRIKEDDKMTIFHCIHIYLSMFILTTILGDLNGQSFDSSWCIVSGYIAVIHIYTMYLTFVNQAFYRLFPIVYPGNPHFLSLKFYTFFLL